MNFGVQDFVWKEVLFFFFFGGSEIGRVVATYVFCTSLLEKCLFLCAFFDWVVCLFIIKL